MGKPIDFIGNILVEEEVFVTLNGKSLYAVQTRGDYYKDSDKKWLDFCKKYNLNRNERYSEKWYNLYLEMCAVGLL